MRRLHQGGFTLIELLTVIAIIAILAAMIFVGFGRVREMARLRSMDNAFLQIRNTAGAYYTTNSTYPIPLGGVIPAHRLDYEDPTLTPSSNYAKYWKTFQTIPWTAAFKLQDSETVTDPFSTLTLNTDLKNTGITILEYIPMGTQANPSAPWDFPDDLPPVGQQAANEIARWNPGGDLNGELRPFTYIAVNKRHAISAARYWTNNSDAYAENWDWNAPELQGIAVPPPAYDAFVLISQGPGGDTGGLLEESPALTAAADDLGEVYYLHYLRAFFLTTRDWNKDGIADLTFQGRNTRDELYNINNTDGLWNQLPPWALSRNGYGPYVFSYGWNE